MDYVRVGGVCLLLMVIAAALPVNALAQTPQASANGAAPIISQSLASEGQAEGETISAETLAKRNTGLKPLGTRSSNKAAVAQTSGQTQTPVSTATATTAAAATATSTASLSTGSLTTKSSSPATQTQSSSQSPSAKAMTTSAAAARHSEPGPNRPGDGNGTDQRKFCKSKCSCCEYNGYASRECTSRNGNFQ